MKHAIKLLFSAIIILLVSGCASSNLSYENNNINLHINDTSLQVHGVKLEEKNENFSTLFLTQKLLRLDDGSLVVFEEARTDMQYQFEPTTKRNIGIIFDAKRVVKVYYNTLIYAFQVVLKDNRVVNVLVTQGYDQKLKMVYGMSTEKLNSMLKGLDPNTPPVEYKNVITLSDESTPILSKWTTWKVHFFPLVVPLPRMGQL